MEHSKCDVCSICNKTSYPGHRISVILPCFNHAAHIPCIWKEVVKTLKCEKSNDVLTQVIGRYSKHIYKMRDIVVTCSICRGIGCHIDQLHIVKNIMVPDGYSKYNLQHRCPHCSCVTSGLRNAMRHELMCEKKNIRCPMMLSHKYSFCGWIFPFDEFKSHRNNDCMFCIYDSQEVHQEGKMDMVVNARKMELQIKKMKRCCDNMMKNMERFNEYKFTNLDTLKMEKNIELLKSIEYSFSSAMDDFDGLLDDEDIGDQIEGKVRCVTPKNQRISFNVNILRAPLRKISQRGRFKRCCRKLVFDDV